MLLEEFVAFALGYILARAMTLFMERQKVPFQWRCPEEGCGFSVKTNNPDILVEAVNGHHHTAVPDHPPQF